jgi:shikimate dehydrogenase
MKVFCILSDERVFRSRSPEMFAAVLKRVGLKAAYVPLMVRPEHLGQALQSLRYLNFAGANVTVPYKERVIAHLNELSEGANIIGAVNTIVRNGDILKGYNTNAIGIMDALSDASMEVAGKAAAIFGTGGAARTAAFILNWLRAESITLVGRNREQAGLITSQFGGRALHLQDVALEALPVQVVINATSVSTSQEAPALQQLLERLHCPGLQLVMDLNYGMADNIWQHWAQRSGAAFMDGVTPLAHQARRTFALWTGLQVPPEEFIKALT